MLSRLRPCLFNLSWHFHLPDGCQWWGAGVKKKKNSATGNNKVSDVCIDQQLIQSMTNIWEEFVFQTGLCQACKRCCVNPQAAFRTTLPSHVAGRNRIIIFLPQNFPFSLWQVVLHRKTTWNFISGWIEITFNSKTLYVNVTTVVYKKSLKKKRQQQQKTGTTRRL